MRTEVSAISFRGTSLLDEGWCSCSPPKTAEAEGVQGRVEFHTMDALRMLEFSGRFFDLVNHRLGASWIRTWDWHKLLQEYQRVARVGAVIRITEADVMVETTSPALTQLNALLLQALHQAGHLFQPTSDGVTGELKKIMEQHGITQVQTHNHALEYRAGTIEGQLYREDTLKAFKLFASFIRKWARLPENYDALYEQMLGEMEEPSFVSVFRFTTAWGMNPSRGISLMLSFYCLLA